MCTYKLFVMLISYVFCAHIGCYHGNSSVLHIHSLWLVTSLHQLDSPLVQPAGQRSTLQAIRMAFDLQNYVLI
jgi:hypothetical protein